MSSSSQWQNIYFNSETSFLHQKSKLRNVWGQQKRVSTLWRCFKNDDDMEQARNLSESWKLDLASQEPVSAQAESLSLVYCRHPDSRLVVEYRTSGGEIHAVNHSTCCCL